MINHKSVATFTFALAGFELFVNISITYVVTFNCRGLLKTIIDYNKDIGRVLDVHDTHGGYDKWVKEYVLRLNLFNEGR